MSKKALLGRVLAVLTIVALGVSCGQQQTTVAPDAQEPTLSGIALLNDRCTVCHTLDRVRSASKTHAGWTATVEGMIQRGAQLGDQEQEVLVDYLAEMYGP